MISFKYSFLTALFGGVIGGFLGAMLTLKIFGDQQPDDDNQDVRYPAEIMQQPEAILRLPRREPVEHDYIQQI